MPYRLGDSMSDGHRTLVGQPSIGRHAIHRIWQMLAELGQEIPRLHAGLTSHIVHPLLAKDILKLVG